MWLSMISFRFSRSMMMMMLVMMIVTMMMMMTTHVMQVGPGDDYVLTVGGFNDALSTLGDSLVTRYSGDSMNGRKFTTK